MKAVRVDRVGGPEQLRLVDAPRPEIGDSDVLIKVEYAGLIYADIAQRRGTYFTPTTPPWYPGREVAGVVECVGCDVDDLRPGTRVVGLVRDGGYAEYVRATLRGQQAELLELPDNVSCSQALPYVANFRFAHVLLHAHARVPREASVLVHGASGGFGSCLTRLARENDDLVIALCRSEREAAFCRSLGADHTFDTTTGDYVERVLDLTQGRGVDFSLNGVGGPTLARDPLAVRTFGEIHAYGYVAGKRTFDPFAVSKTLTLRTFRADDFLDTRAFREATDAMYDWFASRSLLDVTKVFDLANAPDAHRWIEDGQAMGKIALKP